jgi:hypothetical protein
LLGREAKAPFTFLVGSQDGNPRIAFRVRDLVFQRFNFVFFLIRSPYLNSRIGAGAKTKAMKASRVFPHPRPCTSDQLNIPKSYRNKLTRAAYMLSPANGRIAPKTARQTVAAARADAA